ncbi:rhomboid family intramembrane serine protease [Halarcobacter sp.]|uniref:rhomboid family intramembrane serine protease n=1 Tax=Halarcobacter sp. TaxID=2321133 RepID=UPI0029F55FA6|nr:rhomboid family intramembrane serine protease [Halarcobacter sp.]
MLTTKDFTITNIIIVITIIMFLIQTNIQYGSLYLGLNLYFTQGGFYWQPLTSMFSHGGFGHIAMNMFVLYQFGNLIEKYRGKKEFLLIYLVGGVLTSLLSYLYIYYLDNQVNLVGASGAICVLMGYIAYFDKYQRKGIITWILIISVAPILIGLPIAWYSHFIGLALGFLFGVFRKITF